MPVPRSIFEQVRKLIPPLDGTLHKGQSGRVGVFGGAMDYTGAPFFAAITALRFGADLSHVICSPVAAGAIKSYSPDLIVHPILTEGASSRPSPSSTHLITGPLGAVLDRLHVLVLGPGLGREPYMQSHLRTALGLARARGLFVVLDADALWGVCQDPALVRGYARAVLTPNVAEFERLCACLGVGAGGGGEGDRAAAVSRALGGVTILQKGARDVIAVDTTGDAASLGASQIKTEVLETERTREVVVVSNAGGLKRCGGQGDVLSGAVGTMLAWGKCYEDGVFGDKSLPVSRLPILAAVGGSMVTRIASKRAFDKEGRALVTEDMIPEIGRAFEDVFSEKTQRQDLGRL